MTGETTDAAAVNADESKHTQTADRQSELRATCQDELVSSVSHWRYGNHNAFSQRPSGATAGAPQARPAFLLQS